MFYFEQVGVKNMKNNWILLNFTFKTHKKTNIFSKLTKHSMKLDRDFPIFVLKVFLFHRMSTRIYGDGMCLQMSLSILRRGLLPDV